MSPRADLEDSRSPQTGPPTEPARLSARLRRWRATRRASPGWTVSVALIVAVLVLPIVAIVVLALRPGESAWPHLFATVLPLMAYETAVLLVGVGTLTTIVGAGTAWLVTMYRFPGRGLLDRLLVLPLAMPTYIVAYAYVDLLDFAGPVQTWLRGAFGWKSPHDYIFPDVRSLTGAVVVFSAVLYPYVYLAARASFVQQSVCALEVARTLGRTPLGVLREVALPLARPALVAGVALALMETLNDLGAVQYLGVRSLTLGIYDTWLQRSNLTGAAGMASVLLLVIAILFVLERRARGDSRFHHTTGRYRSIPFSDLAGWRAALASGLCLLPVLAGFGLPVGVLAYHAANQLEAATDPALFAAARASVALSLVAAAVAVATAIVLAYARRVAPNGFVRPAVMLAGLGYAVPGTILALGLLVPLAAFDNIIADWVRDRFGVSPGLLFTGSIAALVLAYVVRFLGVALGSLEAGLGRITGSLDAAARTLGETALSALFRVHLPILTPAVGAAALLVFVDCMKELPATLLLRPFDLTTLATHVYTLASLELFEQAAPGALSIVLVGLVPVLLLHRAVAGGRAGAQGEAG
jgi:iron(III) transport system permease protein